MYIDVSNVGVAGGPFVACACVGVSVCACVRACSRACVRARVAAGAEELEVGLLVDVAAGRAPPEGGVLGRQPVEPGLAARDQESN